MSNLEGQSQQGGGVTQEQVLGALRQIIDPDLHRDIVSLGMIKNLAIEEEAAGARVSFTFELTTPACPVRSEFEARARQVVLDVPGVAGVDVKMSANVHSGSTRMGSGESLIPGVRNTIAIASGKGGVGKSTVAANLAVALAQHGATVGLLDADIYGPSIPAMMGTTEKPLYNGKQLIPLEAHGVKLMSIGFLLDGQPVIWRGPMVASAVRQLLSDVAWDDLDYLLIDLPPGTGDAQLTLAQSIPLTGVVVVSTPQDVALNIATHSLQMFRQLHVPILGLIENMSFFQCPECGHRSDIFSHGGARRASEELKVPFLGEVPLDEAIRVSGDQGMPIVARPSSAQAEAFSKIAEKMAAQISIQASRVIPILT